MNWKGLIASVGLVAGVSATLAAQARSTAGRVDDKAIQSILVKVIGCVASGKEAGHYRLVDAVPSGDSLPSPAGTAGKADAGQNVSFENSPSFDLIGGRLKGHVGHKVEVVGITSDTKMNHSDSLNAAIGSSTRSPATLTVSSVKMIAAKCP